MARDFHIKVIFLLQLSQLQIVHNQRHKSVNWALAECDLIQHTKVD